MNSLYFLIPVSAVLLGLIVYIFLWAVRSGQFDDMEGPAHRILDEEEINLNNLKKDEVDSSLPKK